MTMKPLDKAFYDLTVAQRNAAWHEVEILKARLAAQYLSAADAFALKAAVDNEPVWQDLPGTCDTNTHDVIFERLRAIKARP